MKSKIFLVGLIVGMLILSACVYDKAEEPAPTVEEPVEPVETTGSGQVEVVKTVPTQKLPEYDPEIKELLSEGRDADNYYFLYESSKMNPFGSFEQEITFEAYVRGDQARKILSKAVKISNGVYYNEVYLDISKETATAVCTTTSIVCEDNENNAYPVNYGLEKLMVTPLSLIDDIAYDAKVTGSVTFENRKVTAIEYRKDGKNIRMLLDNFYGIPLKRDVYEVVDGIEEVQETVAFKKISVGNVRVSEVTLPGDYSIVS